MLQMNKKRALPTKSHEWLDEIRLAMADARKAKPFGLLRGRLITDKNLFHLAPVVCMKFRGLDQRDEELRNKVTEGALANYVVNSDQHGLKTRPLLAFAVCYVTAHYVLDLIDEPEVEAVLDYCAENMD
jgi:hypothetical protein